METTQRFALSAVVMTALLLALTGCQKQEGPAETAGKKIDKAAEQAVEKVDEAGKKLGEEVEKAGKKMQDAAAPDKK
jgi:outer membrane murein-binding lipoprotein Lpp